MTEDQSKRIEGILAELQEIYNGNTAGTASSPTISLLQPDRSLTSSDGKTVINIKIKNVVVQNITHNNIEGSVLGGSDVQNTNKSPESEQNKTK